MKANVFSYSLLSEEVNLAVCALSEENLGLIAERKQLRAQLKTREIGFALKLSQQVTVDDAHQFTIRGMIDAQRPITCSATYKQWDNAITEFRSLAEQNARLRKDIADYNSKLGM